MQRDGNGVEICNSPHWTQCPTCAQCWTGPAQLGLARARHERAKQLPPDQGVPAGHYGANSCERMVATMALAAALADNAEFTEALQLGQDLLTTSTRLSGAESPCTLEAMDSLDPPSVPMKDSELLFRV